MHQIPTTEFPPPVRKPKHRLSLKTAIAAMSRPESQIVQPLMNPLGDFHNLGKSRELEIEASLLDLQANIIIREGLLNDKEMHLICRERELNEAKALLEAHRKILSSTRVPAKKRNDLASKVDPAERRAFNALKLELLQQEESLKEARKMLQTREKFIEECENELVEQSMILTEREAHVEQREEDHEAKKYADAGNRQSRAEKAS